MKSRVFLFLGGVAAAMAGCNEASAVQSIGQADSSAHPHNVTAYSCDNNLNCDWIWDPGDPGTTRGRHHDHRAVISSRNTYENPSTMAVALDDLNNTDPAAYFEYGDKVWVESLGWFQVEDSCDACAADSGRLDLWIGYGNYEDDASALTRILDETGNQYQVRVFKPGEYVPPELKSDEAGPDWHFDDYIGLDRKAEAEALMHHPATWLWVDAAQSIWGDRMVDGLVAQEAQTPPLLQSDYNKYDSPNSYVWGPYDTPVASYYSNVSKCSTFAAELMRRGRHMTDTYLRSWLGSANPFAEDWWAAVVPGGLIRPVTKIGDLLPGDIITVNYYPTSTPPPGAATGHVATIEPFPETSAYHGQLTHKLSTVGSTDYWAVTVDDSTSTPHADFPAGTTTIADTRHGGMGAGRAVMRLLSSTTDGTILGYSWSYNNSSTNTYLNSDGRRSLRIGRIRPNQYFAPTPPPTSAPILHYTFDSTSANSGTTAGYGVTYTGSASYATGKVAQAVTYGAASYGRVASAPSVLGVYPQYTISFWAFTSTQPTDAILLDVNNRYTAPYGGIQLAQQGTNIDVCVSSTSNQYLGGSCLGFPAPSAGAWHNYIIRYAGSGLGAGQGAGVDIYVDDVLVHSRANDAANDPVFNNSILSTLQLGAYPFSVDEVRVYNQVFTVAQQCTTVLGGSWTGSSCTLP